MSCWPLGGMGPQCPMVRIGGHKVIAYVRKLSALSLALHPYPPSSPGLILGGAGEAFPGASPYTHHTAFLL